MDKRISSLSAVGIIIIFSLLIGASFWLNSKEVTTPGQDEGSQLIPSSIDTELSFEKEQDDGGAFAYHENDSLILYKPYSQTRETVLNSENILDHYLSRDKKFLVYTLKEEGFQGNSDVYLKDLSSGETRRLTEKNNIASLNPFIFPDNKKVAYVRRTYDTETQKLSDGEIWIINSDGSESSSKRILGDDSKPFFKLTDQDKVMDENGKWTGDFFCISKEEIDSVKIGIKSISPDGRKIAYWKAGWAPECSGLWNMSQFSSIDGPPFFTKKFLEQNKFEAEFYGKSDTYDWTPSRIFWLDDGGFIVVNGAMPPLGGESAYYFDKDQNKKWVIFDSSEAENTDGDFSQLIIEDIKPISDDKVSVAYWLYYNPHDPKGNEGKIAGSRYFVKTVTIGDNVTPQQWSSGESFAFVNLDSYSYISNLEIIDSNLISYQRGGRDQNTALFIYDTRTGKERKVGDVKNGRVHY